MLIFWKWVFMPRYAVTAAQRQRSFLAHFHLVLERTKPTHSFLRRNKNYPHKLFQWQLTRKYHVETFVWNIHGERSRNWAEQRRDQARPDPYFYPASYRGTNNRGRGNFSGRIGGGGDDRIGQYGGGGGGRPYNRGWEPRVKRHHWSESTWDLMERRNIWKFNLRIVLWNHF